MHVHTDKERDFPMFAANGILGVRNMAGVAKDDNFRIWADFILRVQRESIPNQEQGDVRIPFIAWNQIGGSVIEKSGMNSKAFPLEGTVDRAVVRKIPNVTVLISY